MKLDDCFSTSSILALGSPSEGRGEFCVLSVLKRFNNSALTNTKITGCSVASTLSLIVDLSMHFDFPERMCMYQSLSLSFSIYICKNVLDRDQTRMEFRKECFVNLKKCACDRKYAKCRTKADAHDKMGFQYISISVYIVRSHARIQRGGGDKGSGPPPPPPEKSQNYRIS